jgi:hypothetical protein
MIDYFCYYNLNKKVFSARDTKTGLVDKTKYSNTIQLRNCYFKVSEAGRQRVLRQKRKNVHAGIVGEIVSINFDGRDIDLDSLTEIYYNPYKCSLFEEKKSKKPVSDAEIVYLIDKRIYAKNITNG